MTREEAIEMYGEWRKIIYPTVTNADRIRAMSDEELAEILWKAGRNYRVIDYTPAKDFQAHKAELMIWLQQPVKEEDL